MDPTFYNAIDMENLMLLNFLFSHVGMPSDNMATPLTVK